MIVRYWNPQQEIETMSRQMDEIFNQLSGQPMARQTTWTPVVRLVDQENAYELTVQLPGVRAEAVDIQASREAVAISGAHPAPEAEADARVLYDDHRYGSFRRVVSLPTPIQNQAVQANFDQGLLTLTLPKAAPHPSVVKVDLKSLQLSTSSEVPEVAAAEMPVVENTETGDVWAADA